MRPFKFAKNRVWRAYKGGALIDKMQGVYPPQDDSFPEEWVASCVQAINETRPGPEGVSFAETADGMIPFDELLKSNPEGMLGTDHCKKYGANTGFLAKILDSAIRLPLQVHPDNAAAKSIYGSRFGKTEAWIVLGTREINGEKPYLIVGFNENLDKDIFIKEAKNGEMPESLEMVYKHDVKVGDVLLIKGGTIHAIGPGMLIYEIMEPTDFVVQPEKYCGDHMLSDGDRFGTVSPDDAMNVFHFQAQSREDAWSDTVIQPKLLSSDNNAEITELINRAEYKYFGAIKVALHGLWPAETGNNTFYSGTVINGSLDIITEETILHLTAGESFFMPYDAPESVFKGNAEIILTLPPAL